MTEESEMEPKTDEQPTPRHPIELVDGATITPLSAEALVIALFATVPDQFRGGVLAAATAVQGQLDKGQRVQIQTSRVVRPGNGMGT